MTLKHLSSLLSATLLISALAGCGQPSDGQSAAVALATEIPGDAAQGFFTNLPQFLEESEIRKIGAKANRPTAALERLNTRYNLIINHHRDLIKGAKLLDFGSYDGRWAYAAIEAGAEHVTGIEINQEFVDQATTNMQKLEVPTDKYKFIVGDLLTELRKIEPGEYDGIICAGIYYHITYHVELMQEMQRLGVDFIIMDSSVVVSDKPIVQWSLSPYGLEGTPSAVGIRDIAEYFDFQVEQLPTVGYETPGMWDYNAGNRITMTLK